MEKANIIFDADDASALRELAASLGFYIRRGPGSGEIGNIKTLLDRLAQVYRRDESGSVKETMQRLLCSHCPKHGNDLALYCSMCGSCAIEAVRTPAGRELDRQLSKAGMGDYEKVLEVERRVRRRVIRCWSDGEYGIVQTSLDGGPWQGGEEVDEEGDYKDTYKLSARIVVK